LIVSGASGGEAYAKTYDGWRTGMAAALKSLGYADDHVVALSNASRDRIQQALHAWLPALTKDDVLFVMLIGHGTSEGDAAKFNLVGPDMTARDWADALKGFGGR